MNLIKNILAADPATKFGWAHSCGNSGVWDLSIKRDESAGMRLIRLWGKLEEIENAVGIDILAYEAARFAAQRPGAQGALVVQAEMQGQIKSWCERHGVEYKGYSSTEIKKHATGKGNANKEAMVKAAEARFAGRLIDHNHADALWLLDLVCKEFGVSNA